MAKEAKACVYVFGVPIKVKQTAAEVLKKIRTASLTDFIELEQEYESEKYATVSIAPSSITAVLAQVGTTYTA